MRMTQRIPATLEAVSEFIQSLDQQWASMPVAARIGLTLPLQELCVNIVEHAYEGQPGQLEIELTQTDHEIDLKITDSAPKAFTAPETISAPDLEDLPEGGMGLFIIYQSFDQVKYQRLPQGNRWHLTKTLP